MNIYHPKAAITIPNQTLTIELTMEQLLEFCEDESVEAFLKSCGVNSLDEVSHDIWYEVIRDWFVNSYWGFQSESMKEHNIERINLDWWNGEDINVDDIEIDPIDPMNPVSYVTITNEMFLIQPTIEQLLETCFEPMKDNRVYITDFLQEAWEYPDGPYSTLDEIPTDVWEELLRDYFINVYYSDTNRYPSIRFSNIGDIKVELLNDDEVAEVVDQYERECCINGFCNEWTEINHLCPDCLSRKMRWDVPELIRKNTYSDTYKNKII
jgi:hypothetical protein